MKRHVLLWIGIIALTAGTASAQTTSGLLRGGIAINEVLPDPSGVDPSNFDTDGDGLFEANDEIVELYNVTGASIDISGLQVWDLGGDNWCGVPEETMLGANQFVVFVGGVDVNGTLPVANGLAIDCGNSPSTGILNNGGDNVVVFDPTADEYIQIFYGGTTAVNPPVDFTGFSATASLVGTAEDWGGDTDGRSLARDPDGGVGVGTHLPPYASPGTTNDTDLPIELTSFDAVVDGESTILRWTATSIVGAVQFEVEHLQDGVFTLAATVPGSISKAEYSVAVPSRPGLNKFRLRLIEADGSTAYSSIVESLVTIPVSLIVSDAYPNPFTSSASFEIVSATEAPVSAKLFNALGQEIAVLFDGTLAANSSQRVTIDSGNLPMGTYLYRVSTGDRVFTRKLLLVR